MRRGYIRACTSEILKVKSYFGTTTFDRHVLYTTTMLFSLTPLLLLAAAAQASVLSIQSPKFTILSSDKSELRSEAYEASPRQLFVKLIYFTFQYLPR